MKRDPSRPVSASKTLPTRHQFEHEVPTHIHDPEEGMTALGRWAHRAMQNPTRFWGTIAALVLGLLAIVLAANFLFSGASASSQVWTRLEAARDPAEKVKLAEDFPQSPAAMWARLEAASDYYHKGVMDLPNNKDVALPLLKKALDNYSDLAKDAPKDSSQARAAALGKARTLEARNELPKAIEQYQFVATTWPDTPEAVQAKQLAVELQKPEAAAFYKDLYAYVPQKVTLPPLGSQNLDMPLIPAPAGGGSVLPEAGAGSAIPSIPLLPPPPPSPVEKANAPAKGAAESAKPAPAPALPDVPFDSGAPAKPVAPAEKPKS